MRRERLQWGGAKIRVKLAQALGWILPQRCQAAEPRSCSSPEVEFCLRAHDRSRAGPGMGADRAYLMSEE